MALFALPDKEEIKELIDDYNKLLTYAKINKTWWNYQKKDKKSQPFIITIINRDTSSCAKCPWFRFCTGCTVDPFNSSFIEVNSNNVIAIDTETTRLILG